MRDTRLGWLGTLESLVRRRLVAFIPRRFIKLKVAR
jgi:hypothetical protein